VIRARLVDGHLADARAAVEHLAAVQGRRTVDNTIRPFDDANNAVEDASGLAAIATQILRPGKSRPASESVRVFLNRPFDMASWRSWLAGR
jgi:Zn-dependent oligopeptidase